MEKEPWTRNKNTINPRWWILQTSSARTNVLSSFTELILLGGVFILVFTSKVLNEHITTPQHSCQLSEVVQNCLGHHGSTL